MRGQGVFIHAAIFMNLEEKHSEGSNKFEIDIRKDTKITFYQEV